MCQYFSKTEDQCSQAMKQAAKEAFESNMHHENAIAETYLSNRECSVQEAIYHTLPELKRRKSFQLLFCKQIFQKKELKYYFLKKNLANYQMIAQIFSRKKILIVM